jgi:hypothetical protein
MGRLLEGVLPDADDFPTLVAKLAGDAFVAGHVVFALFIPELPVGFGSNVALWAAVPETSVDEHGDFLFGKSEVGLSKQSKMPSPASDLVPPEEPEQGLFGLFVTFSPY